MAVSTRWMTEEAFVPPMSKLLRTCDAAELSFWGGFFGKALVLRKSSTDGISRPETKPCPVSGSSHSFFTAIPFDSQAEEGDAIVLTEACKPHETVGYEYGIGVWLWINNVLTF